MFSGEKMKQIKTKKGVLKYRMPNILEAYDLLDASGVSSGETNALKLKRNIMANMSKLIDFSECKDIQAYEDIIADVETFIEPLGSIADEVILKTFTAFKKKTS